MTKTSSVLPPHHPSRSSAVTTVPPWAQDDPPSPADAGLSILTGLRPNTSLDRQDIASTHSFKPSTVGATPQWWLFGSSVKSIPSHVKRSMAPRRSDKDKSPWSSPRVERSLTWLTRSSPEQSPQGRDESMHLELPIPTPAAVFTTAHSQTPGWDTPWTPSGPRFPRTTNRGSESRSHRPTGDDAAEGSKERGQHVGASSRVSHKKRIRSFILNNTYVPLLFRVINLMFTTTALAVAVRIRAIEEANHVMGAVGSSPTLVIIFAPLTIVHVIWAIYLEYFGRPLGLWRTSAKLMHTLSETLFICAWSAALSLSFDNAFTSPLQCTPLSATRWYSELPPPVNPLTNQVGRDDDSQPTDSICDGQSALIALVAVGLLSYCSNLVISLFRIFEKVKYHTYSLRDS